MRSLFLLVFAFAAASAAAQNELARELARLDGVIASRQTYIDSHEQRIESLKTILRKSDFTPEQRYVLNQQLIEEYAPYQADSTIAYLYRNIELAARTGNRTGLAESRIRLAYFYSATGNYFESEKLLAQIDTARLDRQLLVCYYIARHKLNDELQLYTHDSEQEARSVHLGDLYSRLIIENSDEDSVEAGDARLWQAIRERDYDRAERIADRQIELLPDLTHDYAKAAFMRALVAELKNEKETKQLWLARAAATDIQLAIRDNAALNSLARTLFNDDISRAMNYMRVVMEDARFFNSRLRPWQDAKVLTIIEQAYSERQHRLQRFQKAFLLLLMLFTALAVGGVIFALGQNRKLKQARQKKEQAYDLLNSSNDELKRFNEQLLALNEQIAETSTVKEEYIGIFLMMCSEYIDKITESRRYVRRMLRDGKIDELKKEYAKRELDDKELKSFYTMFDTTFLRLYPTFIEEFNSLLDEDARIEVKKGEYLTTELRIFALIRLGINDSSKIAALLRYSVSTIYNYRSKIKCRSSISRDDFERRIKTIGAFYRHRGA